MHFSALLTLCLLYYNVAVSGTVSRLNASLPIRTLYQFPQGTWIENIAVRPNGQLLLTLVNTPELYILDPTLGAPPTLVYRFPGALALTGIAEFSPDVFAVTVGNYSLTSGLTPGSWAVWRVDLRGYSASFPNDSVTPTYPHVSKIADIIEAKFLNGMSQLSERHVLLGDLRAGVVYRLDVNTGVYAVVIADGLTAAVPQAPFGIVGINGLHVHDGYLYFTNTGQNLFAKIRIYADGTPAGNASLIAHKPAPTDYYDDFTFGAHGAVYLVTGSGNSVERLSQSGKREMIIAGSLNSTLLAEPTACAFGRGVSNNGVLYVVTAGGLATPVDGRLVVGGQVVAIDVERRS